MSVIESILLQDCSLTLNEDQVVVRIIDENDKKQLFRKIAKELVLTLNSRAMPYEITDLMTHFHGDTGFNPELVAQTFGYPTFEQFLKSDLLKKYVRMTVNRNDTPVFCPHDDVKLEHIRNYQSASHIWQEKRLTKTEQDKMARALCDDNRPHVIEGKKRLVETAHELSAEEKPVSVSLLIQRYKEKYNVPDIKEEFRKYFKRSTLSKIMVTLCSEEFELLVYEEKSAIFKKLDEILETHAKYEEQKTDVKRFSDMTDRKRVKPKKEPIDLSKLKPILPPIMAGCNEDEDNEFNDEASVADIVPSKFDLGADATKKTVGMNAGFSGRLNSTTSEVRSTLLRPPVVEQCSSSDEDDGFGDDDTCRPTSATIRSKGNDLQLSNDNKILKNSESSNDIENSSSYYGKRVLNHAELNNNSKSFYKESVRKPSDEQSDSVFGDDVAQNYAKSSGGGKFGQFIVSDEDSSDDGAGEMRSFNVPISENYMETGDHLEEDMAMMKSRRDIKSPDIITVGSKWTTISESVYSDNITSAASTSHFTSASKNAEYLQALQKREKEVCSVAHEAYSPRPASSVLSKERMEALGFIVSSIIYYRAPGATELEFLKETLMNIDPDFELSLGSLSFLKFVEKCCTSVTTLVVNKKVIFAWHG